MKKIERLGMHLFYKSSFSPILLASSRIQVNCNYSSHTTQGQVESQGLQFCPYPTTTTGSMTFLSLNQVVTWVTTSLALSMT